ncbi:hypothetical protein ACA910_018960 [Epithemia clementina (nom. ined.)]
MPHIFVNRERYHALWLVPHPGNRPKTRHQLVYQFFWEAVNATAYLIGSLFFVAGSILFLPEFGLYVNLGHWIFFIGSSLYLLVASHDILEVITMMTTKAAVATYQAARNWAKQQQQEHQQQQSNRRRNAKKGRNDGTTETASKLPEDELENDDADQEEEEAQQHPLTHSHGSSIMNGGNSGDYEANHSENDNHKNDDHDAPTRQHHHLFEDYNHNLELPMNPPLSVSNVAIVDFLAAFTYFLGSLCYMMGRILFLPPPSNSVTKSGNVIFYDVSHYYSGLTFIAGSICFVLGGIMNSMQIFKSPSSQLALLANLTAVADLIGSTLFLAGSAPYMWIDKIQGKEDKTILARYSAWLCIYGSLAFFWGAVFNFARAKVFYTTELKNHPAFFATTRQHRRPTPASSSSSSSSVAAASSNSQTLPNHNYAQYEPTNHADQEQSRNNNNHFSNHNTTNSSTINHQHSNSNTNSNNNSCPRGGGRSGSRYDPLSSTST